MWFKEHKKQVIIGIIGVLAVVAALIAGICIGKGKKTEAANATAQDTETTTEATTEKATEAVASSDYDVQISVTTSWETESGYGGTYNLAFTNKSSAKVSAWYAEIEVPEGCKLADAWGCKPEINGTTLTVTATDWGAAVEPGAKI